MEYDDILFAIALLLIAFVAVIGNILVILAVVCHRRLRTPANFLIVNLAVSDFFQGAVSMPLRGAEMLNTSDHNLIRCDFVISLTILFHSASNFNLALIALDRFLAVSQPFAYAKVVKMSSYKVVMGLSWLVSVTLSACPVVGWRRETSKERVGAVCRYGSTLTDEYIVMYVVMVDLIPLAIMFFTYTYIFRMTRKQIRQIQAQEIAVNHAAVNQAFDCRRTSYSNWEPSQNASPIPSAAVEGSDAMHSGEISSTIANNNNNSTNRETCVNKKGGETGSNSREKQVPLSTTRTRKATRTVLAIIGFFVVLCIPITIIDAIELWCDTCVHIPSTVTRVAICMAFANSCVNFFVYGGYNADYRKAYINVWKRVKKMLAKPCNRVKREPKATSNASAS